MQKKTLEEALNTSQQAAVARRVFLRNMSHDIRTPMNAVIGFTNLAIQTDNDPGKVQEYLSKILISSKHLLGIVNNVLEISRIEKCFCHLRDNLILPKVEFREQVLACRSQKALSI